MAELVLDGIAKSFGASVALEPTSLSVEDGEFVVLVGPSGCGKTTLLRMIAGLESPSAGSIRIGGRRVDDLEPRSRDIAMVFQNYALYPHMSVRDNLTYGLRLRRTPAAEISRRVRWAAQLLGLEELLERKPSALSGGQRQRVAMGRAIVREPQLFLFDEPLSNLDARLRTHMRVEIKQLHQRLRTTSVYVTHDQVEAMTLAQRMVVMNKGRIEQVGPPGLVYARPATLFVAGFLGAPGMNLLQAAVVEDGAIALGPARLRATSQPLPRGPVVLGIRPEALRGDPAGDLPLQVELCEALGPETLVHGTLHGQACSVRVAGLAQAREGETMPLSVDSDALHLFAPDGGRRLN